MKAVLPVYYDSNMMYFAPLQSQSEFLPISLRIFLKQNGHQPCSDRDNLCEGCYLWNDSNENSIATSLRVTDALIHSISAVIEDLSKGTYATGIIKS